MRIAHISDLHLRYHLSGTAEIETRLSRQMPEYFERALQQIRRLDPDILVLSGDLLDFPYEGFTDPGLQEQGLADLRLIAALLDTLSVPYVLVHGNHDHPGLIDQVFPDAPVDLLCGGYRFVTFADDEGDGHVPERVRTSRARFLAALDDPDSPPQIHVQHYIVWPERNEGYPHTYGEGEWMRDQIIASGNVRLVLSGHYHVGVPLLFEKGVYFATVPGFAEAPHPYWVYDLVEDPVTGTAVYCHPYRLEG